MEEHIDKTHKKKSDSDKNTKQNISAEAFMIESEEKFRALLESIQEGYFEVDLTGNFTFLNNSVCHVLGYSREELIGSDSKRFTVGGDIEKVFQAYKEVYKTGNACKDFNWHIIRKDGSRRYIEGSISLRKDLSGKPIGFRVIANDFTERRHMEEALRCHEEKYRNILENIEDGYYEVDLAGNFTFFNDSMCRILGYSREEMTGMNNRQYTDKENSKKLFEAFNKVYKTGEPSKGFDWQIIRKDKTKIYIEASVSLRKDSSDKPIGFRGILRDITYRKNAEESLRHSEEKYRTILENIEEGYFEVDLAGNFTFFNDTICGVLGYTRQELVGMNNRQYTDQAELEKVFQAYHKVYQTGEPNKEFGWHINRKDGTKRYIEGSISLFKNSSGKPLGFRGVVRDITERRKIEEKLREEEKRFRAFAEQSSDIILLVNGNGVITYVNSAIGILGIDAENRIGQDVFERVHPDDIKIVANSFNVLFTDPKAPVQKAELRIRNAHGNWHTFEAIASNMIRDNVIEAAIVNLRDITERKKSDEKLRKTLESLRKAVGTTIKVMISAVEMRDPYTAGHQSRAANIARAIATEMGLPCEIIDGIRMAGTIHDIGKLSIPSEILTKPSKLTAIEYSIVKEHSQSGYEVLKNVESDMPLAEIVYQHHERMNGTGYPRSLKGNEIILEARIMAVADVVEAMASHRPYRASLGIEKALEEIENNKGILYDKDVVEACLKLFREKNYLLS